MENLVLFSQFTDEKLFILDDDTKLYPGHETFGIKLGDRKKMGIL